MQVVNKEIKLNNRETVILVIITYMDNTNRFIIQDNSGIIGSSVINEKQAIYNYNRNKKRNNNNKKREVK